MSVEKKELSTLRPNDIWKIALAAVAGMTLVGLIVWEGFASDTSAFVEYFSKRPFESGLIFTLLIAAVGWAVIATKGAIRRKRINQAASAIAVAGIVDPLLRIQLVLAVLSVKYQEGPVAVAVSEPNEKATWFHDLLPAAATAEEKGIKRLKWVQPAFDERPYFENQELIINYDLVRTRQYLVKECLRSTVAKVREWADLLVLTEEGMNALFCLQSLRDDLQDLQSLDMDSKWASACPTAYRISANALEMALEFEDASDPKARRSEIRTALRLDRKVRETAVQIPELQGLTSERKFDELNANEAWRQIADRQESLTERRSKQQPSATEQSRPEQSASP